MFLGMKSRGLGEFRVVQSRAAILYMEETGEIMHCGIVGAGALSRHDALTCGLSVWRSPHQRQKSRLESLDICGQLKNRWHRVDRTSVNPFILCYRTLHQVAQARLERMMIANGRRCPSHIRDIGSFEQPWRLKSNKMMAVERAHHGEHVYDESRDRHALRRPLSGIFNMLYKPQKEVEPDHPKSTTPITHLISQLP